MGCLNFFDIDALASRHGCRWFCETGYGRGSGIEEAVKHPFERIYSVEYLPEVASAANARWREDLRVYVAPGHSPEILEELLRLHPSPGLFWLDAHYPGLDTESGSVEADEETTLPLQAELSKFEGRPGDVILIDDLRIYTGQSWEYDTLKISAVSSPQLGKLDLSQFISTHTITQYLTMEGYLVLEPISA